ncbi:hypothetical protein JCM10213v2_006496 [Rhodosporidiobolus nylandii]
MDPLQLPSSEGSSADDLLPLPSATLPLPLPIPPARTSAHHQAVYQPYVLPGQVQQGQLGGIAAAGATSWTGGVAGAGGQAGGHAASGQLGMSPYGAQDYARPPHLPAFASSSLTPSHPLGLPLPPIVPTAGFPPSLPASPSRTAYSPPLAPLLLSSSSGSRGSNNARPPSAAVDAAAGGRGGASVQAGPGASPAVAVMAAEVGPKTMDKSCKNCRVRKVKCSREWPRCDRCTQRNEECSFGTFVPVDAIPPQALQTVMAASGAIGPEGSGSGGAARVAGLEDRIHSLEAELNVLRPPPGQYQSSLGHPSPGDALPIAGPTPAGVAAVAGAVVSPEGTRSDRLFPYHHSSQKPAFYPVEGLAAAYQGGNEAISQATLSETICSTFVAGAGLGPPGGPAQTTMEVFLRGMAAAEPEVYGKMVGAGVGGALQGGAGPGSLGEKDKEWRVARQEMARMLVVHLVRAFFASCCAYLPSFHGWHDRRQWLLAHVDNLDPASRVAVAAFCAMGARSSPHSALLGIPLTSPSPSDSFAHASAAGVRREQACRALRTQAADLVHLLGTREEATKENLEALMAMAQMLIFDELVPRKSRSMVHSALGQFKELLDSALPPNVKEDLRRHVGLPLLACDAITSAYARKKPLITDRDLLDYFPGLVPPDPKRQSIQAVLQDCLREHVSAEGLLTHDGIGRASEVVAGWIAHSQRLFAQTAAPKAGGPPMSLLASIKDLWQLLDEIHEGVRKLQEMLVHLSYVPHGCASDGCADQHLRFVTRLDKALLDVFFLLHTLVTESMGFDSLVGENGQAAYQESDRRIRKALKLVAFYSELYITSRDPHMVYHVIWQLEVLPNWTSMVVQRHGEPGGPASADLEVSETELDWFVKGLVCASYYHPVAIPRLQELQQSRRPSYPAFPSSVLTLPSAGVTPTPGVYAPQPTHPHPQPQASSLSLFRPKTNSYFLEGASGGPHGAAARSAAVGGGERIPAEDETFTFQGGHTAPSANKAWGDWDDGHNSH